MIEVTPGLMPGARHRAATAPLGEEEAEALAGAMTAFATASRLKLLFALLRSEQSVDELADATSLSSTVVSQQLRVLRLLRLVSARRSGRSIRYRLFDEHVADLLRAIRSHGEHVQGGAGSRSYRERRS